MLPPPFLVASSPSHTAEHYLDRQSDGPEKPPVLCTQVSLIALLQPTSTPPLDNTDPVIARCLLYLIRYGRSETANLQHEPCRACLPCCQPVCPSVLSLVLSCLALSCPSALGFAYFRSPQLQLVAPPPLLNKSRQQQQTNTIGNHLCINIQCPLFSTTTSPSDSCCLCMMNRLDQTLPVPTPHHLVC